MYTHKSKCPSVKNIPCLNILATNMFTGIVLVRDFIAF